MSSKIAVVGLPVVDQVAHIASFPQLGGHVSGSELTVMPGGPACNIAVGISRLGGTVSLVGGVGSDVFGDLLRTKLSEIGVDVTAIKVNPEVSTVTILVIFDQDGQGEQRSFSFGLADLLDEKLFEPEVVTGVLSDTEALFLDGIMAFSDVWTTSAIQVTKNLKDRKGKSLLTVCDPNLRVPGRDLPQDMADRVKSLFGLSDIILLNELEACLVTGVDDPEQSTQILLDRHQNTAIVVVKLGAKGAIIRQRDMQASLRIPALKVEVVDTSGAGDSFGATFLQALVEGSSLEKAGRLACVSGALATTRKGAWLAMPNRTVRDRAAKEGGFA